MKDYATAAAAAAIILCSGAAAAQDVGRVVSSTAVVQQVAVPRQVCNAEPVAVAPQRSGAGAALARFTVHIFFNTLFVSAKRKSSTKNVIAIRC